MNKQIVHKKYNPMSRREFCMRLVAAVVAGSTKLAVSHYTQTFQLRYIVGSSMYGRMALSDVLSEVSKAGAQHIDIWPEHHANHREQIETMGHEKFAAMLRQYQVELGILTHYDLGPFGLQDEMRVAKKLGGSMVISGSRGSGNLKGQALKAAVREFIKKMKPHIAVAEKMGITIGIENHANSLIDSPDAIRWLAEFTPCRYLGIALAPYHLPQDPLLIAKCITDIGNCLVHFYAWQYGQGCHKKLPKKQELMQLPGRGAMDFVPIVAALKKINYSRWTEVFMHPVPRGISILPTAAEVTSEVNDAQNYLELCLSKEINSTPT
ncbi:MAG: sugar phosphate isomerase/epimerase family protein [Planctomycetota bacterium]